MPAAGGAGSLAAAVLAGVDHTWLLLLVVVVMGAAALCVLPPPPPPAAAAAAVGASLVSDTAVEADTSAVAGRGCQHKLHQDSSKQMQMDALPDG
jgi:H+/gluconate symporter-like permease